MAQHDMERMLFKNKGHACGLQGMNAAVQQSGSAMFTIALSSVQQIPSKPVSSCGVSIMFLFGRKAIAAVLTFITKHFTVGLVFLC